MKALTSILLCFASFYSFGQLNKQVTLAATGHLLVKAKGSSLNDAGYGVNVGAALFARHKLQLLVETSGDWFVGNKLLKLDPQGREDKVAVMYSVKAGVQLFILRNIALSATTGPAWHAIQAPGFTTTYGFRYSATGFWGQRKRFVTQLFTVHTPKSTLMTQYIGLGLGYRIY